ncbi:hypothetical protein AWC38_SpisGene17715 [Stylophora pistillata]|uniref:Uncharacterized protein n=1 Tax=Stylophora pistillata TaxID=50429 RepID=A0A2B4RN49_STYPI|nr:hypothetical protein AWC38_SpisGene17715 [Stylophora pistillata]
MVGCPTGYIPYLFIQRIDLLYEALMFQQMHLFATDVTLAIMTSMGFFQFRCNYLLTTEWTTNESLTNLMPPLRCSTRFARQVVEVDGTSYACFLYLIMIDLSMRGATVTPCSHRRIHRSCFRRLRTTSDQCGHCRAPFAVPAAAAIPNEDVTNREQQRQQAIRDLEALLEPGAIKERITNVRSDSNADTFMNCETY